MNTEAIRGRPDDVLKTEKGKIRKWTDLSRHLPDGINPHHNSFLRDYFRAQLRIAEGRKIKASGIFNGLKKRAGYEDFEDEHEQLLAAIDIVVRGQTNWDPKGGPSFQLNNI